MMWLEEKLYPNLRMQLMADSVVYENKTEHQHLIVFENPMLGRVMMLDGIVQTTERDEFIYHEMLAHTPILAHGSAARVLIIGGGDGGMLEEVLKHRAVEKVTMVEIDRTVIDIALEHFRLICGDAFDDPRTDLVIADGVEFVRSSSETYDVIIVDSTDPVGPGEVLFTESFYADCRRRLRPGGILVTQNGVPFFQADELRASMRRLRRSFADVTCFAAAVPMYVGGVMTFGWASDDPAAKAVPVDILDERFRGTGIATRYYSPDVHRGAFAIPPYIGEMMQGDS